MQKSARNEPAHDDTKLRGVGEKLVLAFNEAAAELFNTHPDWPFDIIVWLAEFGLLRLRRYLEEPGNSRKRWESPFIDFDYPVELDWELWCAQKTTRFHLLDLSAMNLASVDTATDVLSEALVHDMTIRALHAFTNSVAFEKQGSALLAYLSAGQKKTLGKCRTTAERNLVLEKLHHPFAMGAGVFGFEPNEMKHGGGLGKQRSKEFGTLAALIHPPLMQGTININGNTLEFRLIFQAHPLTIDPAKRRAFFTITTGIFLRSGTSNDWPPEQEPTWANPANWAAVDQNSFWTLLSTKLQNLAEPYDDEMTEAVVSVHAKLRIPVRKSDLATFDSTSKEILGHLQKTGTIVEYGFQNHGVIPATRESLTELQSRVVAAKAAAEKGRALEQLIKTLFETVHGFEVSTNIITATEEIDISIVNGSDDPMFRNEGTIVLGECKNWTGRCGKNEFLSFHAKIRNRKQRAKLGFLVSWNGFAETITSEMLRGSREEHLVVPLDGEAIRRAVDQCAFQQVLREAWKKAVHL